MVMQSGRGEALPSTLHKKLRSIHRPLLVYAPNSFHEAVIKLAAELITATNVQKARFRCVCLHVYACEGVREGLNF